MESTYLLIDRLSCYECEDSMEILFSNKDKSRLEEYNKIYNNRYEILEVPILSNNIKPYNYISVTIRIYNNFLGSKNDVEIGYSIIKSDTSNIKNIRYENMKRTYTEYNNDATLSFFVDTPYITDHIKDFSKTIGNEIYNIRSNSTKYNNVEEVEKWLEDNFNKLYK